MLPGINGLCHRGETAELDGEYETEGEKKDDDAIG